MNLKPWIIFISLTAFIIKLIGITIILDVGSLGIWIIHSLAILLILLLFKSLKAPNYYINITCLMHSIYCMTVYWNQLMRLSNLVLLVMIVLFLIEPLVTAKLYRVTASIQVPKQHWKLYVLTLILVLALPWIMERGETVGRSVVLSAEPHMWVAHGGGTINGHRLTNSLEALDASVRKGYKSIEVDICNTSNAIPVLSHGWDGLMIKLYNADPKVPAYKEFMDYTMVDHLTQMDIKDLMRWLAHHKDIKIITDIKSSNEEVLSYIANNYPKQMHQIVPQIYFFYEYEVIQDLGYSQIILTLYKSDYTSEEVMDFVNSHDLYALTMNVQRGLDGLAMELPQDLYTYCHTINTLPAVHELRLLGIDGFYTDSLIMK